MTQKIRARYVGGKLELLDAVDLPEGALVSVTVEEAAPQDAGADPLLASAGGWVGLVDFGLVFEGYARQPLTETLTEWRGCREFTFDAVKLLSVPS